MSFPQVRPEPPTRSGENPHLADHPRGSKSLRLLSCEQWKTLQFHTVLCQRPSRQLKAHPNAGVKGPWHDVAITCGSSDEYNRGSFSPIARHVTFRQHERTGTAFRAHRLAGQAIGFVDPLRDRPKEDRPALPPERRLRTCLPASHSKDRRNESLRVLPGPWRRGPTDSQAADEGWVADDGNRRPRGNRPPPRRPASRTLFLWLVALPGVERAAPRPYVHRHHPARSRSPGAVPLQVPLGPPRG